MKYLLTIFVLSFFIPKALADHHASYPTVKSGFWQITDTDKKKDARACLASNTPATALHVYFNTLGGICPGKEIKKVSDSKYTLNVFCSIASVSWKISSIIEGDFKKHYSLYGTSVMNPEVVPNFNQKLRLKGTFLGACPKEIKEGEIVFPDGRKVVIEDAISQIPRDIFRAINIKLRQMSKDFLKNLSKTLQK